jgi:SAM-dependent methyltransferase
MDDYNRFANEYAVYAGNVDDGRTEVELGHKPAVRLLGPHINGKILDVGCGPGNFSRFLKSCGAKVFGIDVSQKEIDIAKSYCDGNEYRAIISGELGDLPCDFDAVTFSFSLFTILSFDETVKTLVACRAKIKPEGKLVILNAKFEQGDAREFVSYKIEALPNPKSGDRVRVWLGKDRRLEVIDYYWTKDDYKEMLRRAGFVIEQIVEPLAVEGRGWLDEKQYSPCTIFLARPV